MNHSSTTKRRLFWGARGRSKSLVFNFCPCKGLFSATGVRRTPSQGAALELAEKTSEATRIGATGQWGSCADVRRSPRQGAALVVAVKAHDMVEVHGVLAHPSEEIRRKRFRPWKSRRWTSGGPAMRACR